MNTFVEEAISILRWDYPNEEEARDRIPAKGDRTTIEICGRAVDIQLEERWGFYRWSPVDLGLRSQIAKYKDGVELYPKNRSDRPRICHVICSHLKLAARRKGKEIGVRLLPCHFGVESYEVWVGGKRSPARLNLSDDCLKRIAPLFAVAFPGSIEGRKLESEFDHIFEYLLLEMSLFL